MAIDTTSSIGGAVAASTQYLKAQTQQPRRPLDDQAGINNNAVKPVQQPNTTKLGSTIDTTA